MTPRKDWLSLFGERYEILNKKGIYFIVNKINNKVYIGKTTNLEKRFREHERKLNANRHHNKYLQHSWNKYKGDNFEFVIFINNIEQESTLSMLEVMLIEIFKTNNKEFGYNLTNGGDGVHGYKHSSQTLEKMKRNHHKLSGRLHPFYGKTHTNEYKRQLSESQKGSGNVMYGKTHSVETKRKISEKMKIENRKRNRGLSQEKLFEINNLLDKGYTQTKISKIVGVPQPTISLIKNKKYMNTK